MGAGVMLLLCVLVLLSIVSQGNELKLNRVALRSQRRSRAGLQVAGDPIKKQMKKFKKKIKKSANKADKFAKKYKEYAAKAATLAQQFSESQDRVKELKSEMAEDKKRYKEELVLLEAHFKEMQQSLTMVMDKSTEYISALRSEKDTWLSDQQKMNYAEVEKQSALLVEEEAAHAEDKKTLEETQIQLGNVEGEKRRALAHVKGLKASIEEHKQSAEALEGFLKEQIRGLETKLKAEHEALNQAQDKAGFEERERVAVEQEIKRIKAMTEHTLVSAKMETKHAQSKISALEEELTRVNEAQHDEVHDAKVETLQRKVEELKAEAESPEVVLENQIDEVKNLTLGIQDVLDQQSVPQVSQRLAVLESQIDMTGEDVKQLHPAEKKCADKVMQSHSKYACKISKSGKITCKHADAYAHDKLQKLVDSC